MDKNLKMTYQEYKKIANQEDCQKFSHNLKPFWWENVPLIGPFIYLFRTGVKQSGLDYGLLNHEITVTYLTFLFSFLIGFHFLFSFLTPWYGYWINAIALKKAQDKLDQDEFNDLQVKKDGSN